MSRAPIGQALRDTYDDAAVETRRAARSCDAIALEAGSPGNIYPERHRDEVRRLAA